MDTSNPAFQEFKAYWQLSEEMIADATKEDIVQVARILAMQAAHYARNFGELPLPDLASLLSATALDPDSLGLVHDGTEALLGVLAMVTGFDGVAMDETLQ